MEHYLSPTDVGQRHLSKEKVSDYLSRFTNPQDREFVSRIINSTRYITHSELINSLTQLILNFDFPNQSLLLFPLDSDSKIGSLRSLKNSILV